jgi:N-acetyl-gamma-glutamyl-phosphate reductase
MKKVAAYIIRQDANAYLCNFMQIYALSRSVNNKQQIKASVVGASGYSGIELVRLLSRHPHVMLDAIIAQTSAGKTFSQVSLGSAGLHTTPFSAYSAELVADSDMIFSALPSGESMQIVQNLIDQGKKVIDLSGDFRLQDAGSYADYYGKHHSAMHLTATAAYGLSELNRNAIKNAQLVSNPGCYATSCILPIVPLIKDRIIDDANIVVTSLSGISGAGKKTSFEYSFTELNDSVQAYKVGKHQHVPEIKQAVKTFGGSEIGLTFVPHLAPITRGIHTTIIAPLFSDVSAEDISASFNEQYAAEQFVALSGPQPPALRRVQQTNMIEIGWAIDPSTNSLVVLSTIDNLLKGAAGQAVQNMNILFGFEETSGL